MKLANRERFSVSIREQKVRFSECYYRWWSVNDSKHRGSLVAKADAAYPDAEELMRKFCATLNDAARSKRA